MLHFVNAKRASMAGQVSRAMGCGQNYPAFDSARGPLPQGPSSRKLGWAK